MLISLSITIVCVIVCQNDAKVGDEFMRQIEAIAGYVPYMTVPGNHENA